MGLGPPLLRMIMLIAAVMNLVFFATFSVRVLFATEILDLDTTGFGVLMAADGGGRPPGGAHRRARQRPDRTRPRVGGSRRVAGSLHVRLREHVRTLDRMACARRGRHRRLSVERRRHIGRPVGFRPNKAAHDALQVLIDESFRGRRWALETDIANCFEAIPHDRLMSVVEERICDRHILKLIRPLLRAGVMEEGAVRHAATGTPQGGVVSPLLANVYLHRLDRDWQARGVGVLCRYADDLVVMCRTRREAKTALAVLRAILSELGLAPREDKTRIVKLKVGGEGLDFLRFHHRLVRSRLHGNQPVVFLARWPSRKAMQHARSRIRELTARRRLLLPVDQIVQEVSRYLRAWAGYFRYGNSAHWFDKVSSFALLRIALFVAKRHSRTRSYGWAMLYGSPRWLELISLHGYVVAPRPNRPWRSSRMPSAKDVGERLEGEPHEPFDGGTEETYQRKARPAPFITRVSSSARRGEAVSLTG